MSPSPDIHVVQIFLKAIRYPIRKWRAAFVCEESFFKIGLATKFDQRLYLFVRKLLGYRNISKVMPMEVVFVCFLNDVLKL